MEQRRPSAKCIVVADDATILLFRGLAPHHGRPDPWWFCPGGGVEAGETFEAAARRELLEEVGLRIDDVGPVVHERDVVLPWEGRPVAKHERYFVVRAPTKDVSSASWTDEEREVITEHRWWSVEALRAATEPIYPEGLADLVDALLGPH